MNRVTLAGRIAADPEAIITKNGATVCRISVACNDISGRKDDVYFFPCVAWEARAKFISTYLKKGSPVVIDGRLQRKGYVNSEGNNVYNTEVVIDNIRSFGGNNSRSFSKDNYDNVKNNQINERSEIKNTSNLQDKNDETVNKTNLNFQDDDKNENKNIIEDFDLDWLDEIDD